MPTVSIKEGPRRVGMQIAQKAARSIDMLNIRRIFVATVLFTAFESSPRDVIVAAACADSKLTRCRNAEIPGIKPQHDLHRG